jgi:PAS domain S-box-containing protein
LLEGVIVGIFAFVGSRATLSRTLRASAISFGLISSSAILVHLSGGYIELHFHFFVMLVFLALYHDWVPYLLAVAYVAIHHGLVGTLWPNEVYNHAAAINAPWTWGGIHAFFILFQCIGSMIAWRFSERAAAQNELILNSVGEGIYGLNRAGQIIFANPVAAEILGLPVESLIGRPIVDLLDRGLAKETDDASGARALLSVLNGGSLRNEGQELLWRGDGTQFPAEYVSGAIVERGERTGAVVSIKDVTKRKRFEQTLLEKKLELENANFAKSEFLAQHQRSETELKTLHDIAVELTSTLDLQRVLQIVLEKFELLLPYAATQIRLLNKELGQLERVACPREERWNLGDDRLQHAIIDTLLTSKCSLAIRDLQADEQNARREFYRQHGWVSYLGVPLIVNDEAIGVLSLFTKSLREFSKREILFAETLAKQASIAIFNSRLYEETKRLSDQLTVSETESRRLANGLIRARDEEAKRIAHTLHDESGQLLALVYIALDELSARLAEADKNQVREIKRLLDNVEDRWRDLSHELHPSMLDHLGLTPTTEYLTAQIAKRTGLQINLSDYLKGRLPAMLELTLFRVVQEGLNNVIRHARASTVDIRITQQEDWIQCAIQDDGIGFDSAAIAQRHQINGAGLGLVGMRERIEAIGGSLEILSTPGEGTKLFISVRRETRLDVSHTDCR